MLKYLVLVRFNGSWGSAPLPTIKLSFLQITYLLPNSLSVTGRFPEILFLKRPFVQTAARMYIYIKLEYVHVLSRVYNIYTYLHAPFFLKGTLPNEVTKV